MWIQVLENIQFFILSIINASLLPRTLTINTFPDVISKECVKEKNSDSIQLFVFLSFFFPQADFIQPGSSFTSMRVCVFMLRITNTCRGTLPSNPCPSLGLSRCVRLQDHITCALNNTHTHTCLPNPVYILVCTDFRKVSLLSQISISVSPAEQIKQYRVELSRINHLFLCFLEAVTW